MHNYENVFLQYYGTKNCAIITWQSTVGIQCVVLYGMALCTVYTHTYNYFIATCTETKLTKTTNIPTDLLVDEEYKNNLLFLCLHNR